jgi:hypothetical protein
LSMDIPWAWLKVGFSHDDVTIPAHCLSGRQSLSGLL